MNQTHKVKNEIKRSKSNIENEIKNINEKMGKTKSAINEAIQMKLSNFNSLLFCCYTFILLKLSLGILNF